MVARRAVLGGLIALALPQAAIAQERWSTYRNDRFGTAIDYPSRFSAGRPPDNNDGLSFSASDGAAFSVWGSFNALEHDLAGLEAFVRENREKDERITYRAAGKTWFVLSGTRGDRIVYKRYMISHRGEVVNGFEISYPAELAKAYDPIVVRMSKSLRPGRGYQIEGAR